MPATPEPIRVDARPGASRAPLTPPGTDPLIEEAFRRFRESAVRLVEQVGDRLEAAHGPNSGAEGDLHMMRSIFSKWSADILIALHHMPAAGFEDLRRSLGGISARVLSIKLKELESVGMVSRHIIDSRPPRVRYTLTERGWTVTWLAQPIFLYIRATVTPSTSIQPSADARLAPTIFRDRPLAVAPAAIVRARPAPDPA